MGFVRKAPSKWEDAWHNAVTYASSVEKKGYKRERFFLSAKKGGGEEGVWGPKNSKEARGEDFICLREKKRMGSSLLRRSSLGG